MTNKFALLVLVTALSFSATAKNDSTEVNKDYGNSIWVAGTNHDFPMAYPKPYKFTPWRNFFTLHWVPEIGNIADQFGVSYQRRVYKNWGFDVGYTTWNIVPSLDENMYSGGQEISDGPPGQHLHHGTIESIERYKMVDLFATYKYNKFKRHKINVGLGISYAWGINTVVDTIYILPFSDELDAHEETAHYYGVAAFLNYDYLLFHNRLAIGYEFKWRKYFGLYSYQTDYGVDLKFNF